MEGRRHQTRDAPEEAPREVAKKLGLSEGEHHLPVKDGHGLNRPPSEFAARRSLGRACVTGMRTTTSGSCAFLGVKKYESKIEAPQKGAPQEGPKELGLSKREHAPAVCRGIWSRGLKD